MRIYFPMTVNILTPGHIRCLRFLSKLSKPEYVYVGLLNKEALRFYKEEKVPFKDRKEVLDTVAQVFDNVVVVEQDSLNPHKNIKKYKCQALASGDGFEQPELEAAKKLKLKLINIKFKGESKNEKRYSSSKYEKEEANSSFSGRVGNY